MTARREYFGAVAVAAASLVFFSLVPARFWIGDTLPIVPTVVQQWQHGNRDLSRLMPPNPRSVRWDYFAPHELPYCVRRVPGRDGVYSSYSAGMELFTWPGVLIAAASGADLDADEVQFRIESATAAWLSAAALGLFFLAAVRIGPPSAAVATTVLLATGSVFLSTLSRMHWHQTGVVFCIALVLCVELRSAGKPGWCGTILQAWACGEMLACRPSAVTFLIPFGLWILARDRRRGLLLPTFAGAAFLPWAAMYWRLYGQPLGPPTSFLEDGRNWTFAANLPGIWLSPGRGMLVYQPWLLLLPLGLRRDLRSDSDRSFPPGFAAFAGGFVVLHSLLIGSWWNWWGGFCYGSRLMAELVPVLGLLAVRPVGWLLGRGWGIAVLLLLLNLGLAVHWSGAFGNGLLWNDDPTNVDRNPTRNWNWTDPPFLYDALHGKGG